MSDRLFFFAMTNRDRIDLLLLGLLWGGSFLFMRVAAPEFGPVALAGLRVGVAAVFLAVVLAWRGGARSLWTAALPLTIVGAINSALPFTLFAYAALSITAGTAAVLNASAPLFAALVAYLWLRDRLSRARVAGLVVGFGGVLILVWDRISLDGGGATGAMLAALGAAVSYGFAVNYTKKSLQGVQPIVTAAGSQIAASLLLLPLCLLHWPSVTPSLVSWLCAIALGVACTGVAYILYFRLITNIGPARAITVVYLVPVFGMLWGLVFLGEAISASMIVACAVILLGTALATGNIMLPARALESLGIGLALRESARRPPGE